MKVIDSSALIKYIAKEDGWENVEKHLIEGCITLDLALKEAANALVKKILRGEVDLETAKKIIEHIPKVVKIVSQSDHFPKALEIATKNKITIYDALFIALAANTNAPLLTSDKEQAKATEECSVITILI
ncbi:MAG: type II toxin-antitoxin system VapC family toxin [Nitrososphaerota archaeon]|nr:type II toxin-antitoxin system VapC family toxin [Candidatus Bathyarchaeota archaeon]MDW8023657.1 type II toxin-antitoxin system VapC family toxin [Nitrososphaerota archaeon]